MISDLLKHQRLRLLRARDKLVYNYTFDDGTLGDWKITSGEFHVMTVDSNVDKSAGLDGNLALKTLGSYSGGTVECEIEVEDYSEISFEYYVQDNNNTNEPVFKFYIDDVCKIDVKGASPWIRCKPIGLTPGKHVLKCMYEPGGNKNAKKAVIDSIEIWQAQEVKCLIKTHTPAYPSTQLASNKTLRGYTSYQQSCASDTACTFTAAFDSQPYLDFVVHIDNIFYYIDEFGKCYRGIFPDKFKPTNPVFANLYFVEMTLIAADKCGVGFC